MLRLASCVCLYSYNFKVLKRRAGAGSAKIPAALQKKEQRSFFFKLAALPLLSLGAPLRSAAPTPSLSIYICKFIYTLI